MYIYVVIHNMYVYISMYIYSTVSTFKDHRDEMRIEIAVLTYVHIRT